MRWGQMNMTAGVLSWVNWTLSRWCPSALLQIHRTEWWAWGGGNRGSRQKSCRARKCMSTSSLRMFGTMNMVSCVSKVNEWKDFQTVFPFFFLCPQRDDNSFASIHHNLHQTDESAVWWLQNKFVLSLRLRWKNRINNASDVSTYGCLCGGATSFSKTSVVKKPREEDWGMKGCLSSSAQFPELV